jgi:hypothetical protein
MENDTKLLIAAATLAGVGIAAVLLSNRQVVVPPSPPEEEEQTPPGDGQEEQPPPLPPVQGGNLTVVVKTPYDQPIEGAAVSVVNTEQNIVSIGTTNARGKWTTFLQPGGYRVDVDIAAAAKSQAVAMLVGENKTLTFVMESGGGGGGGGTPPRFR